jgi:hypothetical protein
MRLGSQVHRALHFFFLQSAIEFARIQQSPSTSLTPKKQQQCNHLPSACGLANPLNHNDNPTPPREPIKFPHNRCYDY